jgi:hypothetical protein
MKSDPRTTAGRAFVRSLNILLKLARLYGYDHVRTGEQVSTAWGELQTALSGAGEAGLVLGATGSQLLLDGVPLEGNPTEKQFAQLLTSAGLASIQFFPSVNGDELARFVRAFPTGKAKPSELAEQLREALAGVHGIRTNEICFVATDARHRNAGVAAQLAAATLGGEHDKFEAWLNDPQKLLELIAAAQGRKGGSSALGSADGEGSGGGEGAGDNGAGDGPVMGNGGGSGMGAAEGGTPGSGAGTGVGGGGTEVGPGAGGTGSAASGGTGGGPGGGGRVGAGPGGGGGFYGSGAGQGIGSGAGGSTSGAFGGGIGGGGPLAGVTGRGGGFRGGSGRAAVPDEADILGILSTLTSLGQASAGQGGVAPGPFQEHLSKLSGTAQMTLKEALASLSASAPAGRPDQSVLVRLAEHLAIKFALERYERGEVKVNAVRQMLEKMNREIENLRKILGQHETKLADAGIVVESTSEILDRQFWAAVPETGKRAVLLSTDAWCIPPRNIRSYTDELLERGDKNGIGEILKNYAGCAGNEDPEARRRAAVGLAELAELYAKSGNGLLGEALRQLGPRLSLERDAEVQALVSAAFVRMSQEAAANRVFPAMEQALVLIEGVEHHRPGVAQNLRPKMGIEDRVPEFVEEALRARQAAAELTRVLKHLPQTAMEHLASRFNRCGLREDADRVASLAAEVGEEGLGWLKSAVRGAAPNEAVELIGLACRLEPQAVETHLASRLKEFQRSAQDRIVRLVAGSGSPSRCRLLLALLDQLDPMVMPLALDEIGMTGDREALGRLLTIADGNMPTDGGPYLRVRAIEALGRIHAPESVKTLKKIVESRQMWRWAYPQELRIAALQSLEKLDPAWASEFRSRSGLDSGDLVLPALDSAADCRFVRQRRHTRVRFTKPISAVSTNLRQNCRMEIKTASLTGGVASIDRHLPPGTQVQLKMQVGMRNLAATAMLRDYRSQDMAFEFVDMSLEERTKFRRLLNHNLGHAETSPETKESPAEVIVSR